MRVSLLFSVAGLVGLFLISSTLTGAVTGIEGIAPEDAGRMVTVEGNITSKHVSRHGHVFFVLDDGKTINVVVFNTSTNKMGTDLNRLSAGSGVVVRGKVEVYRGELEIIAEELSDA